MKNWLSKETSKSTGYIYFNKEKAYATDTHAMVIVKKWPAAEAHFEDAKGALVKPEKGPIPFEKILLKEEEIVWNYEKTIAPGLAKSFFEPWKNAMDFIKKLTKNRKSHPVLLECKNGKLTACSVGDSAKTKVILLEDPALNTNRWEGAYNSNYIGNMFAFLLETEPMSLSMKVAFRQEHPFLEVETEDLIFCMTCLNKNAEELYDLMAFAHYSDDDSSYLE
jgi:hypothetical protein